jgi:hypothetical protein
MLNEKVRWKVGGWKHNTFEILEIVWVERNQSEI